ncbi:MAG TPA: DNA polymerase III subunit gamma/tau [Gammaproteobacteria bacterium]|nr:DNA polymerase III subunit gamma/tau [Gammaproteobacteria bacterium]
MTYQVLARKWRPRNFGEVVGQEHVLRALINALDSNKLHHALLFTGTRGVGKTTLARILAKCLNCEAGVSSKPCGECSSCRSIDAGRFVDLLEVDAASRTKVDDTRELLDNVQYAPTQGRFKVYLIDEVHMLSGHSFNALLKTLEEPPPHVQFLLATTDPQKLPATILSRCLQFNLKRLPAQLIAGHMQKLCEHENVAAEPAALKLLAQAAEGSLRDGLSLLDQSIAFGGGNVTESEVRGMLGTIGRQQVDALLAALAAADGPAVMEAVAALDDQAPDYAGVLDELAARFQRIALAQVVPELPPDEESGDWLAPAAESMAPEYVQLCYQVALIGKRDLLLAPDPRLGFEMVLLRMLAFRPATADEAPQPSAPPAPAKARAGIRPASAPATAVPATSAPASAVPAPAGVAEAAPPRATAGELDNPNWAALVEALPLRGISRELAINCAFDKRDGDTIRLTLDAAHQQLMTEQSRNRLQQALSRHYGRTIEVRISAGATAAPTPAQRREKRESERMAAARNAIETDPNVRALQEAFGAEIKPASIKPLD